jgi:hypothetical protein
LRILFNIAANLRNEQFQPQHTKQMSLFEKEFQTEDNTFASMKIRNNLVSSNTNHILEAMEFLVHFKEAWYSSVNSKGKKIKTYGGLISTPSYNERGYTSFLISSYWLEKLIVIPEYNSTLFNLVYNIKNNKHIFFAIWLEKVPQNGTTVTLHKFNKQYNLNYKTTNALSQSFLKPLRQSLNKFNKTSFNYKTENGKIRIMPYATKEVQDASLSHETKEAILFRQRLRYFKRRHQLSDKDMESLSYWYKSNKKERNFIEEAYKEFVSNNRSKGLKSTDITGKQFLIMIQVIIKQKYQETKTGKILSEGYLRII